MKSPGIKPLRLILLFCSVGLVTAYLPHPSLGPPLPQAVFPAHR